ncbi:CoA-binding protein [Halobiforma lacisalsi AJ5]|uniref:CoA-binding domain protein n=1 Tax=Natronobacterium lacisalsi AJ5 TaxID=358396 RepID=M0LGM1_NATLA|nr:CoA-binding protein [Halobiforma lacisalsi]APW99442.1 CoA-binding protein [Halobiforma lacisalsi AJ5]EMA31554.1 CoA-binding domain protein [Halobiforma lacisalsi AJ5]
MPVESDAEIEAVLEAETVAVVGCSSTPGKAAHDVPSYLADHGYEVYPVNPFADEILGRRAVDSLSELDEEVDVDVVCIFRPSDEVAGIVDEALERDDVEAIWTQLGIEDDEATVRAEGAGTTVVQDRCMKVEHRRLLK